MGRFWWPNFFDATLGFPGEGHGSEHLADLAGGAPGIEDEWMATAVRVLEGTACFDGVWFTDDLTPGAIHDLLVSVAERGNSPAPIAARVQLYPERIQDLLGADCTTTRQAVGGCAYNLGSHPYQYQRPRPIRLDAGSLQAACEEIDRLEHVCHAIEAAPSHDRDKALFPEAPLWERLPLPRGPWPQEKRVPVFSTKVDARDYDADCRRSQHERHAAGRPFRDFESTVFVVPKKDGKFRLCTDYRPLNDFQVKVPFKMDTLQTVAESIQQNDYGMLVDLTDCYLTLGLHPSQRKYCRFRHPANGRRLQWRTISFGMSEAPRICTKLLRPLMGLLKQLGIRCVLYIDDLLILHQDRTKLARGMAIAMNLLQAQVGLNLKTSKCCFEPARQFVCLGFLWDTATMTTSVPRARLWEAQRTARRLIKHGQAPIPTRDLARMVGKITAMTRGIRGARRNLLYVQQQLSGAVRQTGFTGKTSLTRLATEALRWWAGSEPWSRNGAPIVPETRRLQGSVQSDAATETLGWGGTLTMAGGPTLSTRGFFTEHERNLHINALELLGCWHTIRALLPVALPKAQWKDVHLSCELDSVVAIKYAMVANSRSLKMSEIGTRFFDWRERHRLQMSCRHIRGIHNGRADALSRQEWSAADGRLSPRLLRRVLSHWGCVAERDLFASRQNTQSRRYFSWEHDSQAMGVDSLSHAWFWQETLYAYPPQAIIARVLQKVLTESVYDMVLVTPCFPQASWWPTLLQLSTTTPVVLPCRPWVTTDPAGLPSWYNKWSLMIWRISGHVQYARQCRIATRNSKQSRILREIRLLVGPWASVRHEDALLRAAIYDTF